MMGTRRSVQFGDVITGMLVDGVDGTPYVAATLLVDEQLGVRLEVPYITTSDTAAGETPGEWFETKCPPKNLLLIALEGNISLFDCRYSGHTVRHPAGIAVGKITPADVVLQDRKGDHSDPLEVKELRSDIDGLTEWTGFTAITRHPSVDDENRVKKLDIELRTTDELIWTQGQADMALRTTWSCDSTAEGLTINEGVMLHSTFPAPVPVLTHLEEHRKVASLMTFIFGCPITWRSHSVRDQRFTEKRFSQLIKQNTVKEAARPDPTEKQLRHPLASPSQIGSSGLEAWAASYETWGRFIHPAVSALNSPRTTLENVVVNAAVSMEAAGHLIGEVDGENATYDRRRRKTTATFIYRCLARTGWDWSGICESRVGLARALAKNYNTIKHYGRGDFPDPLETYLVSSTATLVVRLLAIRQAAPDATSEFDSGRHFPAYGRLVEDFKNNGLFIKCDGLFAVSS
ncbi:hypothetical protein [Streptomyces chrestomyceticus]|uniref:ApeA N-terminal domain 1-containing protein n=1 Tax=Streptomyces chrestomyceticus TaxID=68185 RepID=UPI0033F26F8E